MQLEILFTGGGWGIVRAARHRAVAVAALLGVQIEEEPHVLAVVAATRHLFGTFESMPV